MRAPNQLAEVMLRYRADHQMSQRDFAKLVGMTHRGVGELECGKNYPSPETLKIIAAVTNWSVEEVGALILSLPKEMTAWSVEPFDDRETRPPGGRAARAKAVERVVVAEPGEGDGPGRGDGDPSGER